MAVANHRSHQAHRRADKATSRSSPPSAFIDWDRCRKDVETSYCKRGCSLKEVMKFVRDKHHIRATEKQFKDQINNKWHLGKNIHEPDLPHLIRLFRQADGDPEAPQVKVRGRIMNRPKLKAYLKRKGKTEDEILAAADANQVSPEYIELVYQHVDHPLSNLHLPMQQPNTSPVTFESSSQETTPSAFPSGEFTQLTTPTSSHELPFEEPSLLDLGAQREPPALNGQDGWDRSSFGYRPCLQTSLPATPSMPARLTNLPGEPLSLDLWRKLDEMPSYNCVIDQILRPDTPTGCTSNPLNFLKILSGSRRVSSQEELLQDLKHPCTRSNGHTEDVNSRYIHEDPCRSFLAIFFGGCMLRNQGSLEGAADAFRRAKDILETMISDRHRDCLTTLHVMIAALTACGQSHVAGEFLATVLVLPGLNLSEGPVAASVEFLIGTATKKLDKAKFRIGHLRSIHADLQSQYGPESPAALTSLYHVAWRSAEADADPEGARQILDKLVPRARKVLGPSHFLTITCMTTMARALYHLHKVKDSIPLMREAIMAIDLRYAHSHPYRWEALHRLAEFLIEAKFSEQAENILRKVVKERADVLGPTNRLTERSLKLLREALALKGKAIGLEDLLSEVLSASR